jgi:hypothetical protein
MFGSANIWSSASCTNNNISNNNFSSASQNNIACDASSNFRISFLTMASNTFIGGLVLQGFRFLNLTVENNNFVKSTGNSFEFNLTSTSTFLVGNLYDNLAFKDNRAGNDVTFTFNNTSVRPRVSSFNISDNNINSGALTLETDSSAGVQGWDFIDGLTINNNVCEAIIFDDDGPLTAAAPTFDNISISSNRIMLGGSTGGIFIRLGKTTVITTCTNFRLDNNTTEDTSDPAKVEFETKGSGAGQLQFITYSISNNFFFDIEFINDNMARILLEQGTITGNTNCSIEIDGGGSAVDKLNISRTSIVGNYFQGRSTHGAFVTTGANTDGIWADVNVSNNIFQAESGSSEPALTFDTWGVGGGAFFTNMVSMIWTGNTIITEGDLILSDGGSLGGFVFSNNVIDSSTSIDLTLHGQALPTLSTLFTGNINAKAVNGITVFGGNNGGFEGIFQGNANIDVGGTTGGFFGIFTGNIACDYVASGGLFRGVVSSNKDCIITPPTGFTGTFMGNEGTQFDNSSATAFNGTMIGNFDISNNTYDLGGSTTLRGTIIGNIVDTLLFEEGGLVAGGDNQVKFIANTIDTLLDSNAAYTTTSNDRTFFWGNSSGGASTNLVVAGTTAVNITTANNLGGAITN